LAAADRDLPGRRERLAGGGAAAVPAASAGAARVITVPGAAARRGEPGQARDPRAQQDAPAAVPGGLVPRLPLSRPVPRPGLPWHSRPPVTFRFSVSPVITHGRAGWFK